MITLGELVVSSLIVVLALTSVVFMVTGFAHKRTDFWITGILGFASSVYIFYNMFFV